MRNLFLFLIVSVSIVACTSRSKQLRETIAAQEITLKFNTTDEAIKPLLQNYNAYVKDNPSDNDWSPVYLWRAAQIYYRATNFNASKEKLETLIATYPDTLLVPSAELLLANIFEEQLKDSLSAAKIYTAFLKKYPNHKERGEAELFFLPAKEKYEAKLRRLNNLFAADYTNKALGHRLAGLYYDYAQAFQQEEKADDMLFVAGQQYSNADQPQKAISSWELLRIRYPQSEKYSQALYLTGFEQENKANNMEKAKEAYELYIKENPKGEFVESAKLSLANLGVSAVELVKSFKEKK